MNDEELLRDTEELARRSLREIANRFPPSFGEGFAADVEEAIVEFRRAIDRGEVVPGAWTWVAILALFEAAMVAGSTEEAYDEFMASDEPLKHDLGESQLERNRRQASAAGRAPRNQERNREIREGFENLKDAHPDWSEKRVADTLATNLPLSSRTIGRIVKGERSKDD